MEIQPVGPTEVINYVVTYKLRKRAKVKTSLLLSNVKDADHQNSCLFTNKGHFSSHLWIFIGVLAKFDEQYTTNSSN